MKNILFLLASLMFLSQIVIAQNFSREQGGHCYSLDIPDYMMRTYQLNEVASLQYINAAREAYIIVIEDSKAHLNEVGMKFTSAEDFLNSFIRDYQINSENRKQGEISTFISNKQKHAQVEISWTSEGTDLHMLITTVETEGYFYKILCWTNADNKSDLFPDFKRAAKSLKE